MFIGHFGVGLGLKHFAPKTNLGWLTTAAVLWDLLWVVFLLLHVGQARVVPGITRFSPWDMVSVPWSHSLLLCLLWGAALGGGYLLYTRYKAGAIALWAGVLSHWILDTITHRADMPFYPNSARVRLGLYNSRVGTVTVEILLLALGAWLYVRATRPRDHIGRFSLGLYLAALVFLFVGGSFGPPPDSVASEAWSGMFAFLVLVFWSGWTDRHRAPTMPAPSGSPPVTSDEAA